MMPARPLALLCLFSACAPAEEEPRAWFGERIVLESRVGVEVCGGEVDFLDRYLEKIYGVWTGSPPADDFFVELDLRESESEGERGGSARTGQDSAWVSRQYAVFHELAHLAVGWEDGRSAPLFTEGAAEMLGPAYRGNLFGRQAHEPELFLYAPDDEFVAGYYAPSAQLMRHWEREFGMEAVRSAYRSAPLDANREEMDATFEAAFGPSYEASIEAFVDAEKCPLQAWECDPGVVGAAALPIEVSSNGGCSDSDLLGYQKAGSEAWSPTWFGLVEFETDGIVRIELQENVVVTLETCSVECMVAIGSGYPLNSESSPAVVEGPWVAGRYFVTARPNDPSKPFSFAIRRGAG